MRRERPITLFLGIRATGDWGPFTFYTSRRRNIIFYHRAPPTKPASDRQRYWRGRFTTAAIAWQAKQESDRAQWNLAARRGHLRITAYDLWVHWQLRRDPAVIRTLERNTGTTLLP